MCYTFGMSGGPEQGASLQRLIEQAPTATTEGRLPRFKHLVSNVTIVVTHQTDLPILERSEKVAPIKSKKPPK